MPAGESETSAPSLEQILWRAMDRFRERPAVLETTALGAACLAGLAVGFWKDEAEIEANWALDRRFEPGMPASRRERLLEGWHRAVERSRGWATPDRV